MRIAPGKIVKIALPTNVIGYTYVEHSPILPSGLWFSYTGYVTVEVPAGEVWKTFGVYFTTHQNHYPVALSIVCFVFRDDTLYGYTGGTANFQAAIPIAGRIWVPLSELVLPSGTYTFADYFTVVYGKVNPMTFTARIMFERQRA
ncbi:MAG: hypothetical protein QXT84_02010 [Candidatus Bathyarchaeia archaeon]